MAGEFALGGLLEGARRLSAGQGSGPADLLLTSANATRLAKRLSKMRGAAMKIGQMLSLESDDLLPTEFTEALAVLRDSADRMPPSQVRRALGRAYGKGWEQRFRSFDFEPIAAASIGQVHAAVAADGRELALKIQYPGVAKSIESDVNNLAAVLRASRILPLELDPSGIIAEAKRQLRREADYLAEAESLERYRALVSDDPAVLVPGVHADLTTARVLAMDRVSGVPLEDLRGPEHAQDVRDELGRVLQHLIFRELFEFRLMQTDPNFSNYLLIGGDRLGLLDFGATQEIPPKLAGLYARLLRAAIDLDRSRLSDVAIELHFLTLEDRADRRERLLDLILLVCEPLRVRGSYDFGASDLAARARSVGLELAFRHGFLRPPPPETLFLHRKLAGTFLLCSRIRARVNARALLEPYL